MRSPTRCDRARALVRRTRTTAATTAPTLCLAERAASATTSRAPGSARFLPRLVGLADGSVVVPWQSDTEGGPDLGAAGGEVIGQRRDPPGDRTSGQPRAGGGAFADSEGNVASPARADGPLAVAPADPDALLDPRRQADSVRLPRFDAAGGVVGTEVIGASAAGETAPPLGLTRDGRLPISRTGAAPGNLDLGGGIRAPRDSSHLNRRHRRAARRRHERRAARRDNGR